nr:BglII/BstYI family type II restriction endonuclease [Desulforamulus aquiferis]
MVTTQNFQKHIKKKYNQNWTGAMSYEKVDRYLRHFKSTIKIPIYLIGIDVLNH